MSNRHRRTRREKHIIDLVATTGGPASNGWCAPIQLTKLGASGLLSRSCFRGPASSTVTQVDIKVWQGQYDATQDPDLVPDEDTVFYRTGIVVAGSATVADDDYNILANTSGAGWDLRTFSGDYENTGGSRPDSPTLWCSVKTVTGTADTDAAWTLFAVDTE